MSTDADSGSRKKPAGMKDVGADVLSDDEAGSVAGGATILPCIKTLEPCLRPSVDPCVRTAGLPGGISSPIRGH